MTWGAFSKPGLFVKECCTNRGWQAPKGMGAQNVTVEVTGRGQVPSTCATAGDLEPHSILEGNPRLGMAGIPARRT